MGFNLSLKHLTSLATLKSCDTTNLFVDDNIYAPLMNWVLEWRIFQLPHMLKCNSSSHELSTLAVNNVYAKKINIKIFLHLCWYEDGPGVRYMTNVKSAGFQFQLEASRGPSKSEELWYNKTVCEWQYMYIYIRIYTRVALALNNPQRLIYH